MKILFITQQFPYPLDNGGNIRTFNILRGLAQEHEITLLATHVSDLPESNERVVARLCRDLRVVRLARCTPAREAVTLARSFANRLPFVLLRHNAAAVYRELRTLFKAQSHPFDAVHFNHLDSTLYDRVVPAGILRVLDQHNVVTNQVRTTLRVEARPLHRAILRRELPKLSAFEAKACNAMDVCLVCSEVDEVSLHDMGVRTQIVVVPNGADLDYFVPAPKRAAANRDVVFVGCLDYDPCEKGAWYFCTEILPLLRRQMTDVRFVVIGRNPSDRLRNLAAADRGIVLTGRVDDVRPHVQAAAVFVVPLLSGSGTRLKIIEAMAMGVPVVSTSIGAEGITGIDGVHFRIADTPAAFAHAVLQVLGSPQESESLRVAGRRLVEERYCWRTIWRTLLSAYANARAPAGADGSGLG